MTTGYLISSGMSKGNASADDSRRPRSSSRQNVRAEVSTSCRACTGLHKSCCLLATPQALMVAAQSLSTHPRAQPNYSYRYQVYETHVARTATLQTAADVDPVVVWDSSKTKSSTWMLGPWASAVGAEPEGFPHCKYTGEGCGSC